MEEGEVVPTNWLARARSRLSPEQWDEIVDAAIEKAMGGDRYARDFLVSIRLPKDFSAKEETTYKEVRIVLAEGQD